MPLPVSTAAYGESAYENKIMLKVKKDSDAAAREARATSQNMQGGSVNQSGAAAATPSVLGGIAGPEDDDFNQDNIVKFHATPQVQEVGTAGWSENTMNRAPASILYYTGSPSRNFTISAKFISRTKKEANRTFRYVNLLRSWRMPYLTNEGFGTAEPEVLHLFGYGNTFRGIPVILRSLNIDYNDDVDYIKTSTENGDTDVPIILPVNISLQEIHTVSDFNTFNIIQFREGKLPWW